MPPGGRGPGYKRLVLIREQNARDRFRFVSGSPNKRFTTRVKWAGCEKPTPPTLWTIQSPGTSFAMLVPVTPTYAGTGEIESFPCP